jgi:aminocarboxymuconate-semialdehyde decarboxylase
MIVDVHAHLVPPRFAEFIEQAAPYAVHIARSSGEHVSVRVGPLNYALNRTFFEPERLLAQMTRMEVNCAVLSLATPFARYDVPASLAQEAAQIYNDEIGALHSVQPDRFQGWAYLPMQDPQAAAMELRRAVRERHLVGGYLPSNVNGQYLDQPQFAPVFETAVELDVPLFIHPSNPAGRERMKDYELAIVAGYLFDTTLNIFNMICGGLLDRYPALRLCCAHVGGYAAMLRSRMQREVDTNPALAAGLKQPIGSYLRSLYFDSICFEPGYARFVFGQIIDPSHLLLGSDQPFPLGEPNPVRFIRDSFSAERPDVAEAVLHRNAAAFLGIKERGSE